MLDVEQVLEDLGVEVVHDAGKYLVGKCPFTLHDHDDVRPGFHAYTDTGHWICFKACGQGRLTDLVMRLRHCAPDEARKWLLTHGQSEDSAELLRHLEPQVGAGTRRFDTEVTTREDYSRLVADRTSQYILDRGFTVATLRSWGFRYDPEVPAVAIPIYDLSGQHMMGLVRREVVSGAQPAKYMYSPLFEKSSHLFGAWRHDGGDRTVLVEGPLDCVWLHQCGVTDAVALMGSHCSHTQQRLLAKLGSRVVLALDGDSAGHEASRRLRQQLSPWFSVRRVEVPDGQDVQDLSVDRIAGLLGGSNV